MLEIDDLYARSRLLLPRELGNDPNISQGPQWTSLLAALEAAGIEHPGRFLGHNDLEFGFDGREQLEAALAAVSAAGGPPAGDRILPAGNSIPFFDVLGPFWRHYGAQIQSSLAKAGFDFDAGLLDEIKLHAGKELSRIADLVLYLEWIKFRDGEAGAPRHYQAFSSRFMEGEWTQIYLRYPVLARLMGRWLLNARRSIEVFLDRLTADWGLLRGAYGLSPYKSLRSLTLGLSDPHAGGQSVIRFAASEGDAVYYKPRAMANEAFFFRNVAPAVYEGDSITNSASPIDRGDYGWMRDLTTRRYASSPSPNPMTGVGRLAGAMHFLNGGDLHSRM